MESLRQFVDVFLHLDRHLNQWADSLKPWLYVVLFLIIFCETGLVVTPFLPGDSLLFAAGALAASEHQQRRGKWNRHDCDQEGVFHGWHRADPDDAAARRLAAGQTGRGL